jgi:uncharacterized protein YoxC
MSLVSVFTIVLLITASALCIALIVYLGRISKAVKDMETDIKNVTSESKPLIVSMTSLSEKLNNLTDQTKEQFYVLKNLVSEIKDRAELLLDLEEKIRGGFEGSVMDTIKNLSAVVNGVGAFFSAYKKKDN